MNKYIFALLFFAPILCFAQIPVAYESHVQKQYLIWAMAKQHNLNFSALYWVIEQESKFNPEALNPRDTDGLPAKGLGQFKDKTWLRMVKECGYDYDRADIWGFEQNLAVMACAWENGRGVEWGPYKEAVRRFGSVVLNS